jgi:hypothetical protein
METAELTHRTKQGIQRGIQIGVWRPRVSFNEVRELLQQGLKFHAVFTGVPSPCGADGLPKGINRGHDELSITFNF